MAEPLKTLDMAWYRVNVQPQDSYDSDKQAIRLILNDFNLRLKALEVMLSAKSEVLESSMKGKRK